MIAPKHAWIAALLFTVACGESPATAASGSAAKTAAASAPAKTTAPTAAATTTAAVAASASGAATGKAAECAELTRVLDEHGAATKKITDAPNAPQTIEVKLFEAYETHGEALKKLKVEDPDVKKLVEEYSAEVEKARAAAKKYDKPETKAQALADFMSGMEKATEIMLTKHPRVCK